MSLLQTDPDLGALRAALAAAGDLPELIRAELRTTLGPNPIMFADMYKMTHAAQLPPNTTSLLSYFEAREGATYPNVVVFGLQFLLQELAATRITQAHVDEAERDFKATFGSDSVFNKHGWQRIVDDGGHFPVVIRALDEGSVVPPGNAIFTIENTNPDVPWITNWLETHLMHYWYPLTVASLAFHQRQVIEKALVREGFTPQASAVIAKLSMVDFGMRGVTDLIAAERGGAAVLSSFATSDNTIGGKQFYDKYDGKGCGIELSDVFCSVPAAEHMTITIWGHENEELAFRNMLETYPTGIVSVVSDSYDYEHAIKALWCDKLLDVVKTRYKKAKEANPDAAATLVIRPDSGDMVQNILMTLDAVARAYGESKTPNGYRVVHESVRVIQGDGIDSETLVVLLDALHENNWSVTNIVLGSGAGLLQKVNRDTQRCAIKACAATIGGKERFINKETPGKKSKRGRLAVQIGKNGRHETITEGKGDAATDLLHEVFRNGKILRVATVKSVRDAVDAAHLACHGV